MTVRERAAHIGLSSPSVTERIHKLQDADAIQGYSVLVDPQVFDIGIAARVRLRAMPGEVKRVAQMLQKAHPIYQAPSAANRATSSRRYVKASGALLLSLANIWSMARPRTHAST